MTQKIVLALIEKEGKFLLIRKKVPLIEQLRWAFPGGIILEEETEEEAVLRQAKQEVGLVVEIREKLFERIHPDTSVNVVYYHCAPKGKAEPKIGEPEEIAKVSWVPASKVLEKFTTDVHPKIEKFILAQAKSKKS